MESQYDKHILTIWTIIDKIRKTVLEMAADETKLAQIQLSNTADMIKYVQKNTNPVKKIMLRL